MVPSPRPADRAVPAPAAPALGAEIAFEVADDAGRPIEGAAVSLIGAAFPTTVFTDASGRAEARVPLEAMTTATALIVHPARGCWPVRVPRPELLVNEANLTVCPRITTTHPDFPDRPLDSWGRRVMGFDRLPPSYRGHATRIALIDSGVAAGHPDLTERIPAGRDIVGQDDKSWQEDHIGTGTHHAVLIAGRDDGTGVVGLAPDAEVHVCRVTPGGWAADLIEALDFCVEQQIDVALIACAIPEPSALVAAKIDEARRSGVACVAAAGDAAGPIHHPAALPGVLSVGAIGQLGTFPADSAEITQLAAAPSPEGLFPARFSNGGPGLDCSAPGVAIISGLPPTSYGPLSGTATAAAHVAAVAALVLAHHPMFRPESGRPQITRDSTRVDRLFEVIKASCRPLPHLDPRLTGAGIPDAAVAVGVAPWGTHTPLPVAYSAATGPLSPADPGGGTLAPLTDAMRAAGLLTGQDES
ncbi:S8 family serine peptidase [Acrocarpospora sp. B8E8]|uniref:S8 family serine peptidase n=1 Tax=Acrocarpospora sp. B8E8 TaxID=3153572 RepID=UPI00325EB95F